MVDWYPLRLTNLAKSLGSGGRQIASRHGKTGIPDWGIKETWECSGVDGNGAEVTNGPLADQSPRQLTQAHGAELVGPGWRGDYFPVLTKFIGASGALPVHMGPVWTPVAGGRRPAEGRVEAVAAGHRGTPRAAGRGGPGVLFLASLESSYVNAATISANGGVPTPWPQQARPRRS